MVKNRKELKNAALEALKTNLPPIVPWSQVNKWMPGLIAGKTLFNNASHGAGPESFMLGNKRCSNRDALISWLSTR